MEPVNVGVAGFLILFGLFALRMPISFAMAFVGWMGYSYLSGFSAGSKLLVRDFFETFTSYSLSVITTFVLMGTYAFAAGISQRLFKASYDLFGQLRGGLAVTTVATCSGFAAICGSAAATAATVGKIAYPEMKKYGYRDAFATGVIATAGTLGPLIPPSTIFIVYGILTEQSIGKLYAAGILPGLIQTVFLMGIILALCYAKPEWGPPGPSTSLRQKVRALGDFWEALVLFGVALGGLFAGFFTPSQAGSVGAGGALILGLLRRSLNWKALWEATLDGVRTTAMILFLIAGATVFGHFLAITRITIIVTDWVKGLEVSPLLIMIVITIIYLFGGCFLDMMPLIVLTVPLFYPIVTELGFDPIWFGVVIVLVSQVGLVSPPVGVNCYVVKGIAPEVPLGQIFKGAVIIATGVLATIILLFLFPSLATWLPSFVKW